MSQFRPTESSANRIFHRISLKKQINLIKLDSASAYASYMHQAECSLRGTNFANQNIVLKTNKLEI